MRCILGCWKIDYFFISADSTLLLFLLEEAGLLIGVHLFFSFSFSFSSFFLARYCVGWDYFRIEILLPCLLACLLAIVNRDEYPNIRSEKFLTRKKTPTTLPRNHACHEESLGREVSPSFSPATVERQDTPRYTHDCGTYTTIWGTYSQKLPSNSITVGGSGRQRRFFAFVSRPGASLRYNTKKLFLPDQISFLRQILCRREPNNLTISCI